MDAIASWKRSRRGFTLVELLAVVVIIGILASLITAAAITARRRAKIARTGLEISQLDAALKAYKEKFGDYPPDFTDEAAVRRHLAHAFPRYTGDWKTDIAWMFQGSANKDPAANLDPGAALVFWLGGVPLGSGSTRLTGFSADPRRPFAPSSEVSTRIGPFFPFDPARLKYEDGACRYFSEGASGTPAPYAYFRARNGGYAEKAWTSTSYGEVWGGAFPCTDTRTGNWANPDSFQIRGPGLDGKFGVGTQYPTGEDYDEESYDDQANFSEGGTLEDKMP